MEDDYMSDAFLVSLEADAAKLQAKMPESSRGPKPSKADFASSARKRKAPADLVADIAVDMSQPLKLEQRMSLKRDQGLAQPIPETNVGHRLLKKMGYVAGTGLGKQASGMAQPLPVDLKSDRTGIGKIQEEKRQLEQQNKRRVTYEEQHKEVFISHASSRFATRKLALQLQQCSTVCRTLDEAAGITSNPLWLPELDEDGVEIAADSKLNSVSSTRAQGGHDHAAISDWNHSEKPPSPVPNLTTERGKDTVFADLKSTSAGAPATMHVDLEDDLDGEEWHPPVQPPASQVGGAAPLDSMAVAPVEHLQSVIGDGSLMPAASADRNLASSNAVPVSNIAAPLTVDEMREKMLALLRYLRQRHCYCFFCAVKYQDDDDMEANCPGLTEEDHAD